MEALVLTGLTGLVGYYFNTKKGTVNNLPVNQVPVPECLKAVETPSPKDIYHSIKSDEVTDQMLKMSINNYKLAENPALTGVIPPLYNTYSSVGQDVSAFNGQGSIQGLSEAYENSRLVDPRVDSQLGSVETRPMFAQTAIGEVQQQPGFSNFGLPADASKKSLLTGLPLETEHENMVPFFGSGVKQNIEPFANQAILDLYAGNTSTYQHKKESGPLFENFSQDIYGTSVLPDNNEQSRYIKSVFKQNEKPFQEVRVSAPIANTITNPITTAAANYKTIDQLRVANNPQISYEGRTVGGDFSKTRGIVGKVSKNQAETSWERKPDTFLKTTGAISAKTMDQNFSNLQVTNRQDQQKEYFGPLLNSSVQGSTTCLQVINSNSETPQELCSGYIPSDKLSYANDYVRNTQPLDFSTNDFGKNETNLHEQERETTNYDQRFNASIETVGINIRPIDEARPTQKQSLTEKTRTGNFKTKNILGTSSAVEVGATGLNLKATQKESLVTKKYRSNVHRDIGMGYEIVKANPENLRNAVLVKDYLGTAKATTFDGPESRENYDNANISNVKESVMVDGRIPGAQKFRTAGGKTVYGKVKFTPNMELKELPNERSGDIGGLNPEISSSSAIGSVQVRDSVQEDTRVSNSFGEIIKQQLSENPFYNLR
jgi:hypothetical protein